MGSKYRFPSLVMLLSLLLVLVSILSLFTPEGCLPPEINMLVTAGVMLIIGAACVYIIKEGKDS